MSMINKQVADLREYADERKGELANLINRAANTIEALSTEIVHCKDCKHYIVSTKGCGRNPCIETWYETDFCNYGERREKGETT